MGEVLSQSEIDSLLAALSSGELDVEDMQEKDERQAKIMTLAGLLNSRKSI
jgi:flagellar motor switch protein FliM